MGASVDLAIEQSLMATLKGNGGLTHGRGFNELNILIWVLLRPVVGNIGTMIEELTRLSTLPA